MSCLFIKLFATSISDKNNVTRVYYRVNSDVNEVTTKLLSGYKLSCCKKMAGKTSNWNESEED